MSKITLMYFYQPEVIILQCPKYYHILLKSTGTSMVSILFSVVLFTVSVILLPSPTFHTTGIKFLNLFICKANVIFCDLSYIYTYMLNTLLCMERIARPTSTHMIIYAIVGVDWMIWPINNTRYGLNDLTGINTGIIRTFWRY